MSQLDYLSRRIGYPTYNAYLRSDHWQEILLYYKKSKCYCCRRPTNLQLHHISYLNLGNESCDDFVTLCNLCHINTHKVSRKYGLDKAHIFIKQNIELENKKYDKLVIWQKLQNKSKKETIYQLRCFLEFFKLIDSKCNATDKAFNLGLAVTTNENKIRWSLCKYLQYKQAYNKYLKCLNQQKKPHKIVLQLIKELGINPIH